MALKKKIEELSPALERVFIAFIFLSVLLSYFFGDYKMELSIVTIVIQVALLVIYSLIAVDKKYILLFLAFIIGALISVVPISVGEVPTIFIKSLGFLIFGIIVFVKTSKESLKHKSFESLNFVLGFLLVMHVVIPLMNRDDIIMLGPLELTTFYIASLCFVSGTVIYNDNLWYRYTEDEKNSLKYVLIISLLQLLKSSLKYI
jgi:hypothetical protein